MPEPDIEGTFIGTLIEDTIATVVKDALHEIRPDIVLADVFPEVSEALKSVEPSTVIRGIVKELVG